MHSKESNGVPRNQRIVIVRLLCIFGMIYVHVPALDSGYTLSVDPGFFHFDFIRAFLIEGYGRTSACLLSIVSGYLVALTLSSYTLSSNTLRNKKTFVKQFYERRFKSIYMPMLMWGVISVALFSVVSFSQPTFLDEVCGFDSNMVASCINVIFHLSEMGEGPTMHLAFLRDLFVCILLAPLLIIALRYVPIVTLAVLTVVYIVDLESVLILRPLVILGFSVGIVIGLNNFNMLWVDRLWMLWAAAAVMMTLTIIAFNHGQLRMLQWSFAEHGLDAREGLLYPLSRLFGSLTIWSMSAKLVSVKFVRLSLTLEPYLFVAFCAHPLILTVIQSSVGVISDQLVNQLYPVWFLFAPAVAITAACLGTIGLSMLMPTKLRASILGAVTGGRSNSVANKAQNVAQWSPLVSADRI